jgi:hypothetical protein
MIKVEAFRDSMRVDKIVLKQVYSSSMLVNEDNIAHQAFRICWIQQYQCGFHLSLLHQISFEVQKHPFSHAHSQK